MYILKRSHAIQHSPRHWYWPEHHVMYFNGSSDIKNQTHAIYDDSTLEKDGMPLIRIPGWTPPEDAWTQISMALLEHDIVCEALQPSDLHNLSIALPDME